MRGGCDLKIFHADTVSARKPLVNICRSDERKTVGVPRTMPALELLRRGRVWLACSYPAGHGGLTEAECVADLCGRQTERIGFRRETHAPFRLTPYGLASPPHLFDQLRGACIIGDDLRWFADRSAGRVISSAHVRDPFDIVGVEPDLALLVGTWNDPTRSTLGFRGGSGICVGTNRTSLVADTPVNVDRYVSCPPATVPTPTRIGSLLSVAALMASIFARLRAEMMFLGCVVGRFHRAGIGSSGRDVCAAMTTSCRRRLSW